MISKRILIKLFLCIPIALFILCNYSCRKDLDFLTDAGAKLRFSKDTLMFDTVFTTQGSANRFIKIFNDNDRPVKISRVYLDKGSASLFNLNVDGSPGDEVKEVEIEAKDSIYVFCEVTINPDNPLSISPFIIEELLKVELNGNTQSVVLNAFGQNANYIPNNTNSNGIAVTTCQLGSITWDDPKPYVIFGVLIIDSCTLNIPAGARVYVHGGIANNPLGIYSDGLIYINPEGHINVQGTKDQPVLIQGDRLEKEFSDVQGQWSGIRIGAGSTNNVFRFTEIKNSIVGVRVDSAAQCKLYNSKIYNTSSSALIAYHSTIVAENCLFYNNGGNGFQAEYGGNYFLWYCTLANSGNDQSALSMNNVKCLDQFCNNFALNSLKADIRNCIITGSQNDEISLSNFSTVASDFNVQLKNCVVKVKDITKPLQFPDFFTKECLNCIVLNSQDKLFKDQNKEDYRLDTLSVAEQKALPIGTILQDILARDRDVAVPDIGCYEYYIE